MTDHVKTRDLCRLFQALISKLEDGNQLDRVSNEVATLLTDTMSFETVSTLFLYLKWRGSFLLKYLFFFSFFFLQCVPISSLHGFLMEKYSIWQASKPVNSNLNECIWKRQFAVLMDSIERVY